jgi:hypothetical protein
MKPSYLKLTLTTLSCLMLMGGVTQAQLGISPSMNSQFLTELRSRSPRYSEEGRDVLGPDRQALEKGRALSRPELFSFTTHFNNRLAADITGFNSQYQMGRKYLSPFYHGVLALEEDASDKSAFQSNFALQQTFEYNSAVNLGKGGVIFSPMLLADVRYQLSPNQSLSFKGGIGLSWISGNDHIDGSYFTDEFFLNVLPGTSLAYDLEFGALHLTVYDRVSVQPRVGMLQNEVGIAGTLALTDQLSWTVNYNFAKTYDIDGQFVRYIRGYNADIHTVSTMLAFQSKGSWSAGLEGSMNWYRPENYENSPDFSTSAGLLGNQAFFSPIFRAPVSDGFFASAGAYVTWNFNKQTRLRVAAGYQYQSFEDYEFENFGIFGPSLVTIGPSETNRPYYSISLSQKFNERTSHELSAGYESNLNRLSQNLSAHFINYGINQALWSGAHLTASAFFEYTDTQATFQPLQITTMGADLLFSQCITQKLSFTTGYSYVDSRSSTNFDDGFTSSDTFVDEIRQHIAGVSFAYAFSAKTRAQLSWQGFYTTGSYRSDMDHHRASLSMRMQF